MKAEHRSGRFLTKRRAGKAPDVIYAPPPKEAPTAANGASADKPALPLTRQDEADALARGQSDSLIVSSGEDAGRATDADHERGHARSARAVRGQTAEVAGVLAALPRSRALALKRPVIVAQLGKLLRWLRAAREPASKAIERLFARFEAIRSERGRLVEGRQTIASSFALTSAHEPRGSGELEAGCSEEVKAESVESGGQRTERPETVADACRAYMRDKPGKIAERVFRRHVYGDPIAEVKLDKLHRHHLQDWRKRLEEAPVLVSRSKGGETRTRPRAKSTVNRDMVPLRAALRAVLTPGAPNTDAAWQEALKPHRGGERRNSLYLAQDERKRLLNAAGREAKPFVRALCLLPLRPGTVAALCAGDFDKRTRALTIGEDKNGLARQVAVPQLVADFLTKQVKGKLPGAPILTRGDGRAWNKDTWNRPIKSAAKTARLRSGVTASALRHSVITDLVRDGLPILAAAQLSGTSVAMIERNYGHLVRNNAVEMLAQPAL